MPVNHRSFHVEASNDAASPIIFPEFELATEPEEKDVEQDVDEVEDEENAEAEGPQKSEDGASLVDGELMCG